MTNSISPTMSYRACRNWAKTGRCPYGDSCRFTHDAPPQGVSGGARCQADNCRFPPLKTHVFFKTMAVCGVHVHLCTRCWGALGAERIGGLFLCDPCEKRSWGRKGGPFIQKAETTALSALVPSPPVLVLGESEKTLIPSVLAPPPSIPYVARKCHERECESGVSNVYIKVGTPFLGHVKCQLVFCCGEHTPPNSVEIDKSFIPIFNYSFFLFKFEVSLNRQVNAILEKYMVPEVNTILPKVLETILGWCPLDEWMARHIGAMVRPGDVILDFGSGNGFNLSFLKEVTGGGCSNIGPVRIIGVDPQLGDTCKSPDFCGPEYNSIHLVPSEICKKIKVLTIFYPPNVSHSEYAGFMANLKWFMTHFNPPIIIIGVDEEKKITGSPEFFGLLSASYKADDDFFYSLPRQNTFAEIWRLK